MSDTPKLEGPDLASGVSFDAVPVGGILTGHVGQESVLLARRGDQVFATGTVCTHYRGPLNKGLMVDDTLRCPWHHACFSLRTGEVLGAPALKPILCWRVERTDGKVFVREKLPLATHSGRPAPKTARAPVSVVIAGGGAAGEEAASTLRFCGYQGPITLLSAEDGLPPDRPNLSKDYLAGSAPADWVPVRSADYYREHDIRLVNQTRVAKLDLAQKAVVNADGQRYSYGALLLATGSAPIHLKLGGSAANRMHYLRSAADTAGIIQAIEQGARRALVIGASFIGLEAAASLRARKLEVHVVAPEQHLMERVFGRELGDFIQQLHASKGVVFHLGHTVAALDAGHATLEDGTRVDCDLAVAGVGVRPQLALAEEAGIKLDRGVSVDEYLRTSVPDVYAAGDIARWPDPHSRERIRVEHWAVAQRQGQTAARNILGYAERYTSVPFFWSQHYDVSFNYVGHAENWERADLEGDPAKFDCAVRYYRGGRALALATLWRDRESLETEAHMEREIAV
ncbi:MAG: FAD-dependent oxidoreductase [Gammaproteobacteria bacterium]